MHLLYKFILCFSDINYFFLQYSYIDTPGSGYVNFTLIKIQLLINTFLFLYNISKKQRGPYMNIPKILIIEDDEQINDLICETLKKENYDITQCFNGRDALCKSYNDFQLIILDIMLPYVDGIDVLREIRKKSTLPIIILSAKTEECDRITGLTLGADDYMIKPFSPKELTARVKSQLRRYIKYNQNTSSYSCLQHEKLELDTLAHKVFKANRELNLTPKEFELLKLFLENPKQVFTKAQIFSRVWGDDYLKDDNTVMVTIKRLRDKIEDMPKQPKYILTVWGIGYKLGD